ncbi:Hypothetical protein A7982_07773 [Minicystis rosea]|nr:Hypothetical protein A7982_07773 [Minicystis rosea]
MPFASIAADGGVAFRQLGWKDDIFGTLRGYHVVAPVFGGELTAYPAAIATSGPLAWLGVHVRFESMVGMRSQRSGHDDVLPTRGGMSAVSIRMRAPIRSGAIRLEVGMARRTFSIGSAGITNPDVPSVDYRGPTFGLAGEIALPAHLSIAPRASASFWTSMGDIASNAWFSRAQAWGLDFGARFAWAGPYGLAPYLDVAWSREILALRPEPGDARVAGGAADDWFTARLGISFNMSGHPSR